MASRARTSFDANIRDIDRLFGFHLKPSTGARKAQQTEVLNKSAIVLTTAFWEAYCEDLAAEALEHLVQYAAGWEAIPLQLQKIVARELERERHELAVWRLAGEGWRTVLVDRLASLQEERNRTLNTPRTQQIDAFFEEVLGVVKLSQRWKWQGMSAQAARAKLDEFVVLRGDIAHRGQAADRVTKRQAKDYATHVRHLVAKTGGHINTVMKKATGQPLWVPLLYRVFAELDPELVELALRKLSSNEQDLMKVRFGINDLRSTSLADAIEGLRTLKETAVLAGIRAEEVRRTEAAIIRKVRETAASDARSSP